MYRKVIYAFFTYFQTTRFLSFCAVALACITNNSNAQMDINLHKNGNIDLICDGQKHCFNNLTEFANNFNQINPMNSDRAAIQSNNYLEAKSIIKSKENDNVIIFKKIHSIGDQLCKLNLSSDNDYKPILVFHLLDKPLILEKINQDNNLFLSIHTNNTKFEIIPKQ